jgi:hypothetical protein
LYNANQLVDVQIWDLNPGPSVLLMEAAYQYDIFGNRNEKSVKDAGGTMVTRFAMNGWNPATLAQVGKENFSVYADLDGSSSFL